MPQYARFELDRNKMIEAVIHACRLSDDDPHWGVAKLVKALYYADCAAYARSGRPITGATYLHFPHGPFPEGWHEIRARMERNGDVDVLYDASAPGYTRYRLRPLRDADLELLGPDDAAILEEQVRRFAGYNAAGIEQYSQEEAAWRSTEDGEPMAYELAGVVARPLSEREARLVANDVPFGPG